MLDKGVIKIDNNPTFGRPAPLEKQMEVDLEDALDIAGSGRYQVQHLALMAWVLAAALLEIIDSSFVLPAAACDLAVKESLKGLITCIPNIGIVLTATLWGRAADHWGRKPVLIVSTAAAGLFGAVAAFMPNLTGYAISKFAMSLFLSPPSSLSFAYCGELMTRRRRDLAMLIVSCLLNISSTLTPLLSWAILPFTWQYSMGIITFRPWRLLTLVNAIPLLLSALLLTRSLESPKFLVTKGRYEEALANLRYIYVTNNGTSDSYPVESLKKSGHNVMANGVSDEDIHYKSQQGNTSAVALLKPPHLKWMALTGFLMFSVFSLLNGLFLFAPDTVNKLMSRTDFNGTICDILSQDDTQTNQTIFEPECNDTITTETFKIMVITTLIYSIIVLVISLTPIPKKFLLVITFSTVGVASLLSGLVNVRLLAAMAMSGLQITALGVGPLTAYAVELFPTTLRGTAVGILMMFGRIGSITGANVAGICLAAACEVTFITWAALMFACALLSLALPKTGSRIAVAMSIGSTSS